MGLVGAGMVGVEGRSWFGKLSGTGLVRRGLGFVGRWVQWAYPRISEKEKSYTSIIIIVVTFPLLIHVYQIFEMSYNQYFKDTI